MAPGAPSQPLQWTDLLIMSNLKLTDIHKSFGPTIALEGVSFEVREGEVHALIGENGAGKSTLMNLIAGALQPDKGLSLIHISEPTRLLSISYAVFCLKK